jgi:hypothetical protein
MSAIIDFVSGRSNKLLRDILAASAVTVLACVGAVTIVQTATDRMLVARQPLPPRLEANRLPSNGPITTVTRSVLDDPVITGSTIGRNVTLDPCTGREKK